MRSVGWRRFYNPSFKPHILERVLGKYGYLPMQPLSLDQWNIISLLLKLRSDCTSKSSSRRPLTWKKNQTVRAQEKEIFRGDLKSATRQKSAVLRWEITRGQSLLTSRLTPSMIANFRRRRQPSLICNAAIAPWSGYEVNRGRKRGNREREGLCCDSEWECRQDPGKQGGKTTEDEKL